jgi:sporulation protein YlmC with PRC-barrel domain
VGEVVVDIDRREVVALGLRDNPLTRFLPGLPRWMPLDRIRQVGDVILVDSADSLVEAFNPERYSKVINCQVITEAGNVLGRVLGFSFDIETGELASLVIGALGVPLLGEGVLSTWELPVAELVSSGPDRIIVYEGADEKLKQLSSGLLEKLGIGGPSWEQEERDRFRTGMVPVENQLAAGQAATSEQRRIQPATSRAVVPEEQLEYVEVEERREREPLRQRRYLDEDEPEFRPEDREPRGLDNPRRDLNRGEQEDRDRDQLGRDRQDLDRDDSYRRDLDRRDLDRRDMDRPELDRSELDRRDLDRQDFDRRDFDRGERDMPDLGRQDLDRRDLGRRDLDRSEPDKRGSDRRDLDRRNPDRSGLGSSDLDDGDLGSGDLYGRDRYDRDPGRFDTAAEDPGHRDAYSRDAYNRDSELRDPVRLDSDLPDREPRGQSRWERDSRELGRPGSRSLEPIEDRDRQLERGDRPTSAAPATPAGRALEARPAPRRADSGPLDVEVELLPEAKRQDPTARQGDGRNISYEDPW